MAQDAVNIAVVGKIGVGYGKINGGDLEAAHSGELADAAKEHIVDVDPSAPGCCIDGRTCVHTMSGSETSPRAAVAGGPLVTGYAGAELVGWFGDDDGNAQTRLARVDTVLRTNGVKPGGHVDQAAVQTEFADAQSGAPKTGCGANDRFVEIMQLIQDQPELIRNITSTLLGPDYDESVMTFLPQEAVAPIVSEWNPRDIVDTLGAETEDSVEILESDPTSPTHGHHEALLVANYRPDTTVDRDSFTKETGEQLFKLDMWYLDKIAKVLAGGPHADKQYVALKHAMTAYQAATYLTLCDGSQTLVTAQ